MTQRYFDADHIRSLFPELPDDDSVHELLTMVSGRAIDTVASPAGTLDDLVLAPIEPMPTPAGYIGFDGFSRAVCTEQLDELRQLFAATPRTRAHASTLARQAWQVLVERVQTLSARTLIAVMHLLREHDRLPGRSGEDRYRQFCLLSATPSFAATLLRTFPELAAQVEHVRAGTVAAVREFVTDLHSAIDDAALADLIGGDADLENLRWAGSDPHAGGRTVLVATFTNGRELVYKPRSMQAEAGFSELIQRINHHAGTNLPTLSIVARHDHGWQEHADGRRLEGADQDAYFTRCGQLLAVLHLLGASDMHYENVLNHDGGPVVVDAETLFAVNTRRTEQAGGPASPVVTALGGSVFATGFLPTRIDTSEAAEDSLDIGFLGYEPGQEAATAQVTFENVGTDQMRVAFATGQILDASPLPSVGAATTEPGVVADAYSALYTWIMDHRAQVMSWVRELFTGVQVRTVVDNTRKYYQLLNLATHPEFQMSPALTEVLFHRCGIGRVDHVTPAVVRAEIADLRRRDIPYFTLRTDRTEVFDSRGRAIANPLAMTPLEHVEAAIAHMSPARRELNAQIICSTYVGKVDQRLDRPGWDQCTPSARGTAGREDMDLVRGIADHYLQQAVPGDGDGPTEWIGSTLSNTAQAHPWRFRQLGDGLYAGRSGLALFLSAAGARFRDERYLDCAERFLLPRAHELLADPAERRRTVVGGMGDGYPGVAYALINGGRLAGRPEWVDRGLELWGLVAADVPALTTTDQLMGSAGILTASCRLLGDGTIPQDAVPGVRRAADEAFQHLVGAPSPGPAAAAGRTYSGYAHGEAGLIAALTLDAQHRPEAKRLVRGIQDGYAARFERSSLPWAISDDTPDRRAHGWCHGAPGILVAELVRQEDGGQDRHEIIEALHRIVLAECLDLNFSLCHGDIGNLAILQRSATFLGDAETQATIKQRLSALVTQILPRRLTARNAKTLLNDAFMVGLPGVGYGLLQLEADGVLPDPFTYGIPR